VFVLKTNNKPRTILGTTLDKMGNDTGKLRKCSSEIKTPKPPHRRTRGQIVRITDPRNFKAVLNQGSLSIFIKYLLVTYYQAVQATGL